jgi:hypothetical protein
LREEFASWTTPKDMPLSSDLSPHVGSFTPPQVFPNTSA